jgi:hypothetical protein
MIVEQHQTKTSRPVLSKSGLSPLGKLRHGADMWQSKYTHSMNTDGDKQASDVQTCPRLFSPQSVSTTSVNEPERRGAGLKESPAEVEVHTAEAGSETA